MRRVIAILLILILAGCTNYPEIPKEYLQPKPEKAEPLKAEVPVKPTEPAVPAPPQVKYPKADPKTLKNFSEKEKEILAQTVFAKTYGQEMPSKETVRLYPNLERYGNPATVVALAGKEGLRRGIGSGSSLLENTAQAAIDLKDRANLPELAPYLAGFFLQVDGLGIFVNAPEFGWSQVVDGRTFLSISAMNPELARARTLLAKQFLGKSGAANKRFFRVGPKLKPTAVKALMDILHEKSILPPFVKKNINALATQLLRYSRDYDTELSFVPDAMGRVDLEKTAMAVYLLMNSSDWNANYSLAKPLIATLLFIRNEDGSIRKGIADAKVFDKQDPLVPFLLEVYWQLGEKGDSVFADAFKKSFMYYSPTALRGSALTDPLYLAWARLTLTVSLSDTKAEGPYGRRLESYFSWYVSQILNPNTAYYENRLFSRKPAERRLVSELDLIQFLFASYRYFQKAGRTELLEQANEKMFFAARYLLNSQIQEADIPLLALRAPAGAAVKLSPGSFYLNWKRKPAPWGGQLRGAEALAILDRLWKPEEWKALKDKAEGLI